jgi:hypothetical protein
MEPLTPQARDAILHNSAAPNAEQLLEEYERLLAERFTLDPDAPQSPAAVAATQGREARLAELYHALFPGSGERSG